MAVRSTPLIPLRSLKAYYSIYMSLNTLDLPPFDRVLNTLQCDVHCGHPMRRQSVISEFKVAILKKCPMNPGFTLLFFSFCKAFSMHKIVLFVVSLSLDTFWCCVHRKRQVPDPCSLFENYQGITQCRSGLKAPAEPSCRVPTYILNSFSNSSSVKIFRK